MNNILDYFKERSKDKNWYNKYFSCSKNNFGNTFKYISTNFRDLFSFVDVFKKFYDYNGLERSQWTISKKTGQEEAKQWITNMTQSKLFKKDKTVFNLTEKGKAFYDFVSQNFNQIIKFSTQSFFC